MVEDYCFQCGSWTRIDATSKLCRRCYDNWPCGNTPTPDKRIQGPEQSGRQPRGGAARVFRWSPSHRTGRAAAHLVRWSLFLASAGQGRDRKVRILIVRPRLGKDTAFDPD
jgi:hypothetical protein